MIPSSRSIENFNRPQSNQPIIRRGRLTWATLALLLSALALQDVARAQDSAIGGDSSASSQPAT